MSCVIIVILFSWIRSFSRFTRHSSQEFVDADWRRRDEKKNNVEFEESRFDDSVIRIVSLLFVSTQSTLMKNIYLNQSLRNATQIQKRDKKQIARKQRINHERNHV